MFMPPYVPPEIESATLDVLQPRVPPPLMTSAKESPVKWHQESATFKKSVSTYSIPLAVISMPPGSDLPKQITFHRRGDYFSTVCK
jgi:ribosome biogenesis protein ERB1